MSNIEKSNPLRSEAFREQFKFDYPLRETSVPVGGHNFVCIGNNKSNWADIHVPDYDTAFLSQEGDITIINPDKSAQIAYIDITSHVYLYYVNNGFRNTDTTSVVLRVFPRDPGALREGERRFANALVHDIPAASFIRQTTDDFLPRHGAFPPHRQILEKHVTEKISEYGLTLAAIGQSSRDISAIEQLCNSPLLSEKSDVREAFIKLLEPLFQRTTHELLPVRRDTPLLGQPPSDTPNL